MGKRKWSWFVGVKAVWNWITCLCFAVSKRSGTITSETPDTTKAVRYRIRLPTPSPPGAIDDDELALTFGIGDVLGYSLLLLRMEGTDAEYTSRVHSQVFDKRSAFVNRVVSLD